MRGAFALVLVVGATAAAGIWMWSPGADPAEADGSSTGDEPPALRANDPGESGIQGRVEPRGDAGQSLSAADDARAAALATRLADLLDEGHPGAAATTVLRAEASVLAHTGVRREVWRALEQLMKAADSSTGAAGTKQRLTARRLSAALFDCDHLSEGEYDRALRAADELNQVLVFGNGAPEELVLRHEIQPDDRLWTLANKVWPKQGISVESGFVLHANGLRDARRLRAGKTLRVPREQLSVLIRKSRFELTVLLGGVPVESFDVGIGAAESTPVGRFEIETKIPNPDWYFDNRKIPFGDPENVIGTRWLGFVDDARAEGIGIHGTNDETTVGKAVSMGCIRMRRVDVERIFEWIPRGAVVEVRE